MSAGDLMPDHDPVCTVTKSEMQHREETLLFTAACLVFWTTELKAKKGTSMKVPTLSL